MYRSPPVSVLVLLMALHCAPAQQTPAAPPSLSAKASAPACDAERDHAAILAMAGSYTVEFAFEESVPLAAGYELRPPSKTGATELVLVLEDAPDRVSLQHVLVVGASASSEGNVVKHWRQDWAFQDAEILDFLGTGRWQRRSLAPGEAGCSWTQAVFEVDDSPRYEGSGHWRHDAERSVWQSNETWRPLPRREYTKRSDYDVLVAVNRHRITKTGWDHEQDNVKLVLEPRKELVRERGLNRYTRIAATATEPAQRYWQGSAPFWLAVRAEWRSVLAAQPKLGLQTEVDGKRLYEHLFPRATEPAPSQDALRAFIHDTIASYLTNAE